MKITFDLLNSLYAISKIYHDGMITNEDRMKFSVSLLNDVSDLEFTGEEAVLRERDLSDLIREEEQEDLVKEQ